MIMVSFLESVERAVYMCMCASRQAGVDAFKYVFENTAFAAGPRAETRRLVTADAG